MIYELVARNTDSRYPDDVRWREYTSSERTARLFERIPKLQFTDSGHGIVFCARPHRGPRKERNRQLADYVRKHLARASQAERLEREISRLQTTLAGKQAQLIALASPGDA